MCPFLGRSTTRIGCFGDLVGFFSDEGLKTGVLLPGQWLVWWRFWKGNLAMTQSGGIPQVSKDNDRDFLYPPNFWARNFWGRKIHMRLSSMETLTLRLTVKNNYCLLSVCNGVILLLVIGMIFSLLTRSKMGCFVDFCFLTCPWITYSWLFLYKPPNETGDGRLPKMLHTKKSKHICARTSATKKLLRDSRRGTQPPEVKDHTMLKLLT